MGLKAIYRRPRISQPGPGNKIYPYLLTGMEITRPNQVWCADITYIPMAHGFMYLVVIMDWYSRYVLAWRLSNTLDADFCVEALKMRLEKVNRMFLILTRDPNLPARLSPGFWSNTESKSAWMGKEVTGTTCLSRGYGGQ